MKPYRHTCLFAPRTALDDRVMAYLDGFAVRLLADCPDIRRYRFAKNLSRKAGAYTLVLDSEFADAAAFERYVRSPAHDEIAAYLEPLIDSTLIADTHC